MRTFSLNKLIKDSVFLSMQALGQEVTYRILDDDEEFRSELLAKFKEELAEYQAARTLESREKEWGDLRDLVYALADLDGVEIGEATSQNEDRKSTLSVFAGRIFVETVSAPEGDVWADYYAKEPSRFPEE